MDPVRQAQEVDEEVRGDGGADGVGHHLREVAQDGAEDAHRLAVAHFEELAEGKGAGGAPAVGAVAEETHEHPQGHGDDVPEALFEGLKVATDKEKMKFGEKESNLLLVVGDCGNRLNDNRSPSQNEIVKRLIDNQFQVVAFQVRRMNQQPYNSFQNQMGQIIV